MNDVLPKSCARWTDPPIAIFVGIGLYVVLSPLPLSTTVLCLLISTAVTIFLGLIELIDAPWHAMPRPPVGRC